MELSLYKALTSIKIEEPLVDSVIKSMDTYIDAGISKSVVPVLAEIRSLATRVDSLKGELSAKVDAYAGVKSEQEVRRRWIVGLVFTVVATAGTTIGATITVLKVFGYL